MDLANGRNKPVEESEKTAEKLEIIIKDDKNVTLEDLKAAWDEFTEQRKSQVGEYHLLKQEFSFQDNQITIHLSNPVEEPLLQTIRTPLTEFLRERLGNSRINISSKVREIQSKKIAYTNKEKFDHLAEKNPILNELKDRLGLDTDF
jgi:DNA polymerase-3 subunit gamma/tau